MLHPVNDRFRAEIKALLSDEVPPGARIREDVHLDESRGPSAVTYQSDFVGRVWPQELLTHTCSGTLQSFSLPELLSSLPLPKNVETDPRFWQVATYIARSKKRALRSSDGVTVRRVENSSRAPTPEGWVSYRFSPAASISGICNILRLPSAHISNQI
jgi:hypothetical protein